MEVRAIRKARSHVQNMWRASYLSLKNKRSRTDGIPGKDEPHFLSAASGSPKLREYFHFSSGGEDLERTHFHILFSAPKLALGLCLWLVWGQAMCRGCVYTVWRSVCVY